MSAKKREAEVQLIKDDVEADGDDDQQNVESGKWKAADSATIAQRRLVKVTSTSRGSSPKAPNPFATLNLQSGKPENSPTTTTQPVFGFSSYANANPFAAAFAPEGAGLKAKPPSLTIPSPKSPKVNPFSNPSPVTNPFMSINDSDADPFKLIVDGTSQQTDPKVVPTTTQLTSNGPTSSNEKIGMKGDDGDGDKDVGNDGEEEADEGANAAENAEDSNTSFKPSPLFQGRTPIAVVTGEEDETCTLQLRAKLYRLMSRSEREKDARAKEASKRDSEKGDGISDAEVGLEATSSSSSTASKSGDNTSGGNAEQKVEWVEVGVGPLRVLRANQSSGHSAHNTRLVMRRESDKGGKGTKLILNVLLRKQTSAVAKTGDNLVRLSCMSSPCEADAALDALVPSTFLFKTKSVQESDQLLASISEAIADSLQRAGEGEK